MARSWGRVTCRSKLSQLRQEYLLTLTLNPRSFPAWWGLANLAEKAGNRAEVRDILTRAVAAGIQSASMEKKLAEIEAKAGDAAVVGRKP